MSFPFPPDEVVRLQALDRYAILDTPPEESFDRFARYVFETRRQALRWPLPTLLLFLNRPESEFLNAMAYEKAFYDAGGILAAGVDPTGNGGALPGYGDQRNYELFIEAGFTPEQAVQVLTANGARVLDVFDDLGTVEAGKLADLIVMRGDLTADPSVIREVTVVFKDGVGYDSPKMLADVRGRVGIN